MQQLLLYLPCMQVLSLFVLVGRQTLVLMCYHMFLFAILETVWPGIPKLFELLLVLVLLTAAGYGKEKLYAKKQGG